MFTQNIINIYKISIKRGLKTLEDIDNLELRKKVEESLSSEENNNETN